MCSNRSSNRKLKNWSVRRIKKLYNTRKVSNINTNIVIINISTEVSIYLCFMQKLQTTELIKMDKIVKNEATPRFSVDYAFPDVIEELNAGINAAVDRNANDCSPTNRIFLLDEVTCDSPDSGWDTDLEDELEQTGRARHDITGESHYIKACNALKIIPSSHIISCLSKTVLSLPHRAIGPKEIKAITEGLVSNTFVKILDLQDNSIGKGGITQVLRLLLENCFISEVNLSENSLGARGAEIFSHIFKNTRTLKKVDLKGNRFGDKDCSNLADGLSSNDTIKVLSLSHNEFMLEAGKDMGMAVARNYTLTELDLSWNHLRMGGAVAFAKGMAENCSIKKLNLSFNGFSDNGAEAMGAALAGNNTLRELDISNNRISDIGAVSLSKGLAKNTALKRLNISHNPITKDGGLALLVAVKDAKELMELLMDDIFLDSRAVDLIQEMLQAKRPLIVTYGGVASVIEGHNNEMRYLKKKIFDEIRKYLKEQQLRMVDLFNRWDKNKDLSLSREEFQIGIGTANIPLAPDMVDYLVNQLDVNEDGVVEYDEFVALLGIK